MFGLRRFGLGALRSEYPSLRMDDSGFTRTWSGGAKVLRTEWAGCSTFVAQPSGGRVPEINIVWTCNGRRDWMSSRVVAASDLGDLVATMNRYRDAAIARGN